MLLVQPVHLRVRPAAALPPSPHTPSSSGRAAAHATIPRAAAFFAAATFASTASVSPATVAPIAPTSTTQPSAASKLAAARAAADVATPAVLAARLPPDCLELLHDRERLLRWGARFDQERVRGRRHGA